MGTPAGSFQGTLGPSRLPRRVFMRQMSPEYASSCEHLYLKVKTLLLFNHKKELANLLQSLGLVCYWNMTPMQGQPGERLPLGRHCDQGPLPSGPSPGADRRDCGISS